MNVQDLGDRMKKYEFTETYRQFMPMLPVYARIDGRGFSRFTKGMKRPYDSDMSAAMVATVKYLIEHTHARIGYTQSDEISLVWLMEDYKSDIFFCGKTQKMVSVLASMATAAFTHAILAGPLAAYAARLPHFDARVFSLPNKTEATNMFLWREIDATKNAVSMAARHYYSHKELHGKSSAQMQEMLFAKGINFNDYPPFFKRGVFLRRILEERTLTHEERLKIPENNRPPADQIFARSRIVELDVPKFSKVLNRETFIFDGHSPIVLQPTPDLAEEKQL